MCSIYMAWIYRNYLMVSWVRTGIRLSRSMIYIIVISYIATSYKYHYTSNTQIHSIMLQLRSQRN